MLASALVASLLSAFAQDPLAKAESSCYKDKPVDEYIVELNKRQKGSRNPLPNDICIFGMCAHTGMGPKDGPKEKTEKTEQQKQPAPKQAPPTQSQPGESDESSSKQESAGVAGTLPAEASSSTYDPVSAARDVDVGDYYYRQKNYRGALMRYADAAKSKPGDAAIHLRMGRGWEKLGAPERAYLEYDATVRVEPEGKSAAEAQDAMQRLKPELQKGGVDPAALVVDNQPEKAPCLAAPAASR